MSLAKEEKKYTKVGPYLLRKPIGKGAFSIVYEATKEGTLQRYAVKQMQLLNVNKRQLQRIYREIQVLTLIKHPNIVALVDSRQTKRHLYLVFEHCQHTDLQDYIQKNFNGKLPEEEVKKVIIQIKKAFIVLRQNKIVHRDLKLSNILLTEDFSIKLADFGFANLLPQDQLLSSCVGTPYTMAPQILNHKDYNEKCDIWSLGIIIYQMHFGSNPFFQQERMSLREINEAFTKKIAYPFQISLEAKAIIEKMLVIDPCNRMTFEEFFIHSWLKEEPKGVSLNTVLRNSALRAQIAQDLVVCNKNAEEKEFITTNSEAILSYSFLSHFKDMLQNQLMLWASLGRKIIHLSGKYPRLGYLASAILIENIKNALDSEFSIILNQVQSLSLPKYVNLRDLEFFQLNQYSKGLLTLLAKSVTSLNEYVDSVKDVDFSFLQMDQKIAEIYLRALIEELNSNQKGLSSQLKVFLQIKPWCGPSYNFKVTSSVFDDKTIKILIQKLSEQIRPHKYYKKHANIFKFSLVRTPTQLNPLYQIMKRIF